jgi:hypothetical protein
MLFTFFHTSNNTRIGITDGQVLNLLKNSVCILFAQCLPSVAAAENKKGWGRVKNSNLELEK